VSLRFYFDRGVSYVADLRALNSSPIAKTDQRVAAARKLT